MVLNATACELPRSVSLGARVLLQTVAMEEALALVLSGVDSRGTWFLGAPPGLGLTPGTQAVLFVRGARELRPFRTRVQGTRRRVGMPSLLALDDPQPHAMASLTDLVEVPTLAASIRLMGGRSLKGHVRALALDSAVLRLSRFPRSRTLHLRIEPPADFLAARARTLQRSRPGTGSALQRLRRVYRSYFANLACKTLGEAVPVREAGRTRWEVGVRFQEEHPGVADLVRFYEIEAQRESRRAPRREDTVVLDGLF